MKFVIDTSIIIAVITNENHKKQLIDTTKGSELLAPSSLHWEVGNAFSAMFKRKRLTIEEAKLALIEYKKIPIQFYDVTLEIALEYAYKYDIYAYDAYFLICADKLKLPILSLDNSLLLKAREAGLKVFEVKS